MQDTQWQRSGHEVPEMADTKGQRSLDIRFGRADAGLVLAIYATVTAFGIALFPMSSHDGFFGSAGWMVASFVTALLAFPATLLAAEHRTRARGLLILAAVVRITVALVSGDLGIADPLALAGIFLPALLAVAAVPLIGPFPDRVQAPLVSERATPETVAQGGEAQGHAVPRSQPAATSWSRAW